MYKTKRKRGVVLTSTGIKRLQSAILSVEIVENKGEHLSLEKISSHIHVSSRTRMRSPMVASTAIIYGDS